MHLLCIALGCTSQQNGLYKYSVMDCTFVLLWTVLVCSYGLNYIVYSTAPNFDGLHCNIMDYEQTNNRSPSYTQQYLLVNQPQIKNLTNPCKARGCSVTNTFPQLCLRCHQAQTVRDNV